MGILTDITKKITRKVEEKYHFTVDNFIIEKEQQIGKTEQLNSSEKPNTHNEKEKINRLSVYGKIIKRYCYICGKQTEGGNICSDECYETWEINNKK